jgi:hypothetical protein
LVVKRAKYGSIVLKISNDGDYYDSGSGNDHYLFIESWDGTANSHSFII